MRQPFDEGYLTQGYKENHRAYDIGWISRTNKSITNLYAIADGEVAVSGWFGNGIPGDKDEGTGAGYEVALYVPSANKNYKYLVVYVHLKECLVKKGEKVTRGQVIGIGDSTGISSGPHLHFEIWKVPIDYQFTGWNFASARNKYAIEPGKLVNFTTISPNSIAKLEKYTETPISKIATTTYKELNMRDYPSTSAFSAGFMGKELEAVAITTKIRGYIWVKCKLGDKYVYVAENYVTLKDKEADPCEPVVIEVEKPFKETIKVGSLDITIERKAK